MRQFTLDECREKMKDYDVVNIEAMEMMDSSRGDEDIRHNYILDKKYVLRVNSAEVFSEERFHELNSLIVRYQNYGIKAPLFLQDKKGVVLHKTEDLFYYVSEYLDGIVPPDDLSEANEMTLTRERLSLISTFANKYKDVELSSVVSMYSLFDLSPYDELIGMDEKQDNLNGLVQTLRECGEENIAVKLELLNKKLRDELFPYYKSLPRCFFQGDENWGNMIVDEDYHILGLFDFNMAGTEVIVNYFANNALLTPDFINEKEFGEFSATEIYHKMIEAFRDNTEILKNNYEFSDEEELAYHLYANVVMISSYPNVCALKYFIKNDTYKTKAIEFLELLMNYREDIER